MCCGEQGKSGGQLAECVDCCAMAEGSQAETAEAEVRLDVGNHLLTDGIMVNKLLMPATH